MHSPVSHLNLPENLRRIPSDFLSPYQKEGPFRLFLPIRMQKIRPGAYILLLLILFFFILLQLSENIPEHITEFLLQYRLFNIINYPQLNRLFHISKIIIADNDKTGVGFRILSSNPFYEIQPIDNRHINIHEKNIRPHFLIQ